MIYGYARVSTDGQSVTSQVQQLTEAGTSEGRAHANARGQSLGRPHKLTPHQRREALQRKGAGESVREIARSYAVSGSAIGLVDEQEAG